MNKVILVLLSLLLSCCTFTNTYTQKQRLALKVLSPDELSQQGEQLDGKLVSVSGYLFILELDFSPPLSYTLYQPEYDGTVEEHTLYGENHPCTLPVLNMTYLESDKEFNRLVKRKKLLNRLVTLQGVYNDVEKNVHISSHSPIVTGLGELKNFKLISYEDKYCIWE